MKQNERLASMNERVAGINERRASMNERVAGMNERLAGINERLASINENNYLIEIVAVNERKSVSFVEPGSPGQLPEMHDVDGSYQSVVMAVVCCGLAVVTAVCGVHERAADVLMCF